jgi:hypothetical protein
MVRSEQLVKLQVLGQSPEDREDIDFTTPRKGLIDVATLADLRQASAGPWTMRQNMYGDPHKWVIARENLC